MAQRITALQITGTEARQDEAFPPKALALIARLELELGPRRKALLQARSDRQVRLDSGAETLGFRADTAAIRAGDWRVAPIPDDLLQRRVEITGPVDPKMVINGLNSGADVFMADFEDATSPTWANLVQGQLALRDAARKTLHFTDPTTSKQYALQETTAALFFRPRGLHLGERHIRIEDQPTAGFFVDAATCLLHTAAALIAQGKTPALYVPKLERAEEAAFVGDALTLMEEVLGLPRACVKVTVLLETLPAAFEMHEILHALKDRIVGLNCGRWDYIFSCIKRRRADKNFISPDRSEMTMDKGFLRAYSQLLIQTCHRRGAFAMGGMSAFIPVKGDPEKHAAAMAKVIADKDREANDGHDGTWVAHPGLVELARAIFDKKLAGRKNQLDVMRDDVVADAAALLAPPAGERTDEGLRHNLRVGVTYLAAWLDGNGCVPIDNLMEDAATAEIARAQIWQWLAHKAPVGGKPLDAARLKTTLDEETAALDGRRVQEAKDLFLRLSTDETLAEFLTLPAYEQLRS
ncbi:MAG: malate synthase A [Deltaproteobacteria bacterium]|nr:malate synthase A [Deltaproteobacteria bacterium]